MSLASTLREALERGHRHQPELIAGDVLEEEAPGGPTPAAVLVAVVERPAPGVILTLRPETMRKHPGQISFPGGRIDPGDDGPHPYLDVRAGLEARLARPVYYELAEIALAEAAEPPGVWSDGAFFALVPGR